jgi:hypothetical protein
LLLLETEDSTNFPSKESKFVETPKNKTKNILKILK